MRLLHAAPGRLVAEVGEVDVQMEVGGLDGNSTGFKILLKNPHKNGPEMILVKICTKGPEWAIFGFVCESFAVQN